MFRSLIPAPILSSGLAPVLTPRALTLTAALLAAGMTTARAEVALETATGTITLPAAPTRPVVYDLAALDTLIALGVIPAGVPSSPAVPVFDPVKEVPVAGTLFEPDLEALAALNPDLIVIGGRSADKASVVAPLGPVADMTVSGDIVGTARARIGTWGALFGKQAEAATLTAAFDAKLAGLRDLAQNRGKALVVLTGGERVSAFGIGSRMGWLHDLTGLPEAKPGLSTERLGNQVSPEDIAEINPDWIFVIDRSAAVGQTDSNARAHFDNPQVAGTTAGKQGQIVYLAPWAMYLSPGGYNSTMQVMDELIAALQG